MLNTYSLHSLKKVDFKCNINSDHGAGCSAMHMAKSKTEFLWRKPRVVQYNIKFFAFIGLNICRMKSYFLQSASTVIFIYLFITHNYRSTSSCKKRLSDLLIEQ